MTDPLIKPHFSGLNIRVQIDILIRINMERENVIIQACIDEAFSRILREYYLR